MSEPRWLAYAWTHLGEMEVRGARHNPRIQKMFKDVGHPTVTNDETAWCAAFVGACLERAGIKSTRSLRARSYLTWGEDATAYENPIGAVAVLSRGANRALGHVGFLVGQSAGKIWLLGGNQSDAVTVASYRKSRLLALRWAPEPASVNATRTRNDDHFNAALDHVLKMEGGFTDDPVDPGGPTNKGITLAVYAAWRKVELNRTTRPKILAELKRISAQAVREIYRKRYWRPAACAEFPAAIGLMHFDAAVNHGVGTANRILQEAVRVDIDGEIGPDTRAAVRRTPVRETLKAYARIRRRRYRSLHHFWRFGRGWLNRVDATLARAIALADPERTARGHVQQIDLNGRGDDMLASGTEAGVDSPKWWGRSVTIWGAVVTAAATVLPALAPLIGVEVSADVVRQVGAEALTAVQAVVGLLGTAITIYGRLRAKQPLARRTIEVKL